MTISGSVDRLEAENKALKKEISDLNQIAKDSDRILDRELKELSNLILVLEDNLARANIERLAELASIMRLIQALDTVSIEQYNGAISLIKAVLYQAICKLDPSQLLE